MLYIYRIIIKILRLFHLLFLLSDERYLKMEYYILMRKRLNLKDPKTYNEKLQWLKLHDRKEEYTKLADKYEVKEEIAKIIGKEYIIPTLEVYDSFDEIDFDKLPNQFVIKCTHDSGGVVVCKDKTNFNIKEAKKIINKTFKKNYFWNGREWPYKNIKPRIIVEEYMEDKASKVLDDYKFFCFNGEPKLMFIATERQNKGQETCFDFYDMQFNHLNINNGHPNSTKEIKKPKNFELMKKLASSISKNMIHSRIDFYEINGKVYFGEVTFYHWSGFVHFEPEEWDYKLGELIKLPIDK